MAFSLNVVFLLFKNGPQSVTLALFVDLHAWFKAQVAENQYLLCDS